MKYLISLFIFLLLAGGALALNTLGIIRLHSYFYYSVCNTPIAYHIGKVDPQFGLSTEEFRQAAGEAVSIWNMALKRKLFVYDSKGELTLNLSYDERQGLSSQINTIEQDLNARKSTIDPTINEYKTKLAEYETKLDSLNTEIRSWNEKGGAPPDVYERLQSQQNELKQDAADLQAMAHTLNQSTDQFNQEVGELNQKVGTFNAALQEKPEEGIYNPKDDSITVYFNNDHDELIHTLAHEFGHARGMDHIQNEDAIMYPSTNDVIQPSADDLSQMTEICKERSLLTLIKLRFQLLGERIALLISSKKS